MTDELDRTTINPPDTDEPAPEPNLLTSQVLPPPAGARRGRYRWAVAVGVVAVVVAASALLLGLFTGRASDAAVLGYVPSDSIMYGEVRLDLPGDQRVAVGRFLSRFPGFADQSILDSKIDEVLDRIVGEASDGQANYSTDIKPWFGGQLAFSVGALPDPNDVSTTDPVPPDARFLALLSVKDEATARSWMDATVSEGVDTITHETYNGADLTIFGAADQPLGAYAILGGKVLVVGDPVSVRASVDTKGASEFAQQAQVKAALDSMTGDHVGFAYVALRPLLEWSSQAGATELTPGLGSDLLTGLVPEWTAFALRVESDALVMESIAPKPTDVPAVADRTSPIVERVPSTTIALSVSHDYGAGVLRTLDTYRADPALKEVIDAIDSAAGVLGGAEAAVGWIGDFGIALSRTPDGPVEGGLVIVPTDRAAAERFFTSLRTLVALGGGGLGITVRDEVHGATTITIVDLGEAGDLLGQAGVPSDMLGEAAPSGRVELAFAITDQVVVLGSGPGFVRSVLDTTTGTSLASTDRYRALAERVGPGSGVAFADITALRELFETALAANEPGEVARYEQEVKPFLVPFDALIGATSLDGELGRSKAIVTTK